MSAGEPGAHSHGGDEAKARRCRRLTLAGSLGTAQSPGDAGGGASSSASRG